MDPGRYFDLIKLNAVLNDPAESALHKRQARRAFEKIKKTINDKKLQGMRRQLIGATRANDVEFVDNISEAIRDHMLRTYGHV